MVEIKEQKEIISESKVQSTPLTTSDQIEALVSTRVDKIIYDKLNKLEEKMNDRIEIKETKTTEILAIFITLFTFISVNVSIFTRVSDISTAIWFFLLMTFCSIILVSVLIILLGREKKESISIFFLVASFILLFALLFGTGYMGFDPKLNLPENNGINFNK